jgi:hypothetical protein
MARRDFGREEDGDFLILTAALLRTTKVFSSSQIWLARLLSAVRGFGFVLQSVFLLAHVSFQPFPLHVVISRGLTAAFPSGHQKPIFVLPHFTKISSLNIRGVSNRAMGLKAGTPV